jgi:hypothetical protein
VAPPAAADDAAAQDDEQQLGVCPCLEPVLASHAGRCVGRLLFREHPAPVPVSMVAVAAAIGIQVPMHKTRPLCPGCVAKTAFGQLVME